jgi:hypothetical protein
VGLEPLRQQFVVGSGHVLWSQSVIILDETDPIGVTREANAAGSFVIEDSGMGCADGASGKWQIEAGSASGELAGLKGSGSWTWEKGSQDVAYSLSYEL